MISYYPPHTSTISCYPHILPSSVVTPVPHHQLLPPTTETTSQPSTTAPPRPAHSPLTPTPISRQISLVSTYVVCERLSVMHEPAGVVEILVQILPEYPLFWSTVSEYPPPPKMKIVRESKSKSFRIPPPPNENCQRVQIWEFQNTPPPQKKMKIVREFKSESFRIPPQMKIVRESKSESFRIPPPNQKNFRFQTSE